MKTLLHKFALWLWLKTHVVTATEIMMLKEAENTKCVNCGKSPFEKSTLLKEQENTK